jgi:hypothetical protein
MSTRMRLADVGNSSFGGGVPARKRHRVRRGAPRAPPCGPARRSGRLSRRRLASRLRQSDAARTRDSDVGRSGGDGSRRLGRRPPDSRAPHLSVRRTSGCRPPRRGRGRLSARTPRVHRGGCGDGDHRRSAWPPTEHSSEGRSLPEGVRSRPGFAVPRPDSRPSMSRRSPRPIRAVPRSACPRSGAFGRIQAAFFGPSFETRARRPERTPPCS